MIRKTLVALGVGAMAFVGTAASAQYYENYDRSYRWNGDFPRGSWERTCRDARMSGPVLRARCDNGHGRWTFSSIDVRGCPGERIRNTWGRLTCSRAGLSFGDGYGYGMPRGSWAETCRGSRMRGSVLTAVCDDGHGRYRPTSIDVRACYSHRIKNSWGRLICD